MCRHCPYLGENPEEQKLAHDFLAMLTRRVNRKLSELDAVTRAEVDELEFQVTVPNRDIRSDLPVEQQAKVIRLLYRNLIQPFRSESPDERVEPVE